MLLTNNSLYSIILSNLINFSKKMTESIGSQNLFPGFKTHIGSAECKITLFVLGTLLVCAGLIAANLLCVPHAYQWIGWTVVSLTGGSSLAYIAYRIHTCCNPAKNEEPESQRAENEIIIVRPEKPPENSSSSLVTIFGSANEIATVFFQFCSTLQGNYASYTSRNYLINNRWIFRQVFNGKEEAVAQSIATSSGSNHSKQICASTAQNEDCKSLPKKSDSSPLAIILSDFPKEIITAILKLLPAAQLVNCYKVSRLWKSAFDRGLLKTFHCEQAKLVAKKMSVASHSNGSYKMICAAASCHKEICASAAQLDLEYAKELAQDINNIGGAQDLALLDIVRAELASKNVGNFIMADKTAQRIQDLKTKLQALIEVHKVRIEQGFATNDAYINMLKLNIAKLDVAERIPLLLEIAFIEMSSYPEQDKGKLTCKAARNLINSEETSKQFRLCYNQMLIKLAKSEIEKGQLDQAKETIKQAKKGIYPASIHQVDKSVSIKDLVAIAELEKSIDLNQAILTLEDAKTRVRNMEEILAIALAELSINKDQAEETLSMAIRWMENMPLNNEDWALSRIVCTEVHFDLKQAKQRAGVIQNREYQSAAYLAVFEREKAEGKLSEAKETMYLISAPEYKVRAILNWVKD